MRQHEHQVEEFRKQCGQIRVELEQAYKDKVKGKVEKEVGYREKEFRFTYEQEAEASRYREEGLKIEVNRLKKELKRVNAKNYKRKQQEQENISRIEEEVTKSLARVLSTNLTSK